MSELGDLELLLSYNRLRWRASLLNMVSVFAWGFQGRYIVATIVALVWVLLDSLEELRFEKSLEDTNAF